MRIDGELTIHTAADEYGRLRAALDGGSAPDVDLSGVTDLDTAGVQVLLAFRREAQRTGVAATLRAPSRAVRDVLVLAGLEGLTDG